MADNEQRDKLIAKLNKMFALANDPGATKGEAENALAFAQELMRKHNIYAVELVTDKQTGETTVQISIVDEEAYAFANRMHEYKQLLAVVVSKITTTEAVLGYRMANVTYAGRTRQKLKKTIRFVGDEIDVAVAKELFMILLRTTEGWMKRDTDFHGSWTRKYLSYCDGMVSRFWERVQKEEKKHATSNGSETFALVVRSKKDQVSEFMREHYQVRAPKRKRRRRKVDFGNWAAGHKRGGEVDISAGKKLN